MAKSPRSQILLSFKGKKRIIALCPICKAEYRGKYVLANHISRVHEKKRPYLCTICGKSQISTYKLKMHYQEVHEGKRPHICEICGKSFKKKAHVKLHMACHEENKSFQCHSCPKKFTSEKYICRNIKMAS